MSNHSRLNISQAEFWMTCAAWPRVTQDAPDTKNEDSIFGDISHNMLANALMMGEPPSEETEEGQVATVTFDYARKRWLEMGIEDTELLVENHAQLMNVGRDDIAGDADIVLYNENEIEVIDHKTGPGTFVEPDAPQFRLYAKAFMQRLDIHPAVIKLTVAQPRFWDETIEPIRTLEMTHEELDAWINDEVLPAAQRTDHPDAPGTVTSRCKKCNGKDQCSYRKDAVTETLVGELIPMTQDAIHNQLDKVVYDNATLSNDLTLIPVIRDFCDSLEKHAQEIIMKGETVPGYKVVDTGGRTKWTDEETALEALNKSRVKHDDYTTSKLKTPKQVLSLKKVSKDLHKKLDACIGKSEGGLALVLETDPRDSAYVGFEAVKPEELPAPAQAIPAALPDFLL